MIFGAGWTSTSYKMNFIDYRITCAAHWCDNDRF